MVLYPDPSHFCLRGWCSSLGVKGKGLCFASLFNYMCVRIHIQIHTLLLRSAPFYSAATDVTGLLGFLSSGVIRISGGKNVKLYAHTVHTSDLTYGDNAPSKVRDSKIGNSLITSLLTFLP